jgi:hypothetical protein
VPSPFAQLAIEIGRQLAGARGKAGDIAQGQFIKLRRIEGTDGTRLATIWYIRAVHAIFVPHSGLNENLGLRILDHWGCATAFPGKEPKTSQPPFTAQCRSGRR